MNCPACRRDIDLNKVGNYTMHRITDEHRHRYSFCPMSGQPYTPQADDAAEVA